MYIKLKDFKLRDLLSIWEDLRSNLSEYRKWIQNKRADKNFPVYLRNYPELLNSTYINQLKVGGVVAQLEHQLTNYRELLNYHFTGRFERKEFRFEELITYKKDLSPIDKANYCYSKLWVSRSSTNE